MLHLNHSLIDAVQENDHCLMWELYETYLHSLVKMQNFFNIKANGTYKCNYSLKGWVILCSFTSSVLCFSTMRYVLFAQLQWILLWVLYHTQKRTEMFGALPFSVLLLWFKCSTNPHQSRLVFVFPPRPQIRDGEEGTGSFPPSAYNCISL